MVKKKRFLLTLLFLVLFFLMLLKPTIAFSYASTGLTLWFQKMIPTLLPFMILSQIMIHLNISESFTAFLSPVIKPLFRVSGNGVYCIFMGFLCGFPMGANITATLYEQGKISRKEASFLLSFCNNIGPIYFLTFVLPLIQVKQKIPCLLGMYGLPLLYGIFVRNTAYRKEHFSSLKKLSVSSPTNFSMLEGLDDSICKSLFSIAKLGGYMVLFNLLNLLPAVLLQTNTFLRELPLVLNVLLEITSGISAIGDSNPLLVLVLLPFGGFSCMAQTYSMIKATDLSIGSYFFHKINLTLLSGVYYVVFFSFFC